MLIWTVTIRTVSPTYLDNSRISSRKECQTTQKAVSQRFQDQIIDLSRQFLFCLITKIAGVG